MFKNVKIANVYYEMLLVDSKKKKLNPQELLEKLIESSYNSYMLEPNQER